MNVLIRSAEIIDRHSPYHGETKNLLIEDGVITRVSDKAIKADKVIEGSQLKVSIGWMDMRVLTGDPGHEQTEDIKSICAAAANGGFTAIATLPNTKPGVQTKDVIYSLKARSAQYLTDLHPMASVTLNNEGKDMTEMIDLHHAGAVAFTDGHKPLWHSDVMLKSLQYMQPFDGLLINHCEDLYLNHSGQMHEGKTSTVLGLKGLPRLAEELMVQRDISILEYTGGRLHIAHISSPRSLDMIREAKKKGLKVSCDIAAHQLMLDDTMLAEFDTNLKVNPPLRSKQDIEAYWKALADHTIDVIVSDHIPVDVEGKKLEFDLADFGINGIETMFSVVNTANKRMKIENLVSRFTEAPRNLLRMPLPKIEEGAKANLTVFDPELNWLVKEKDLRSRSRNNPFIGMELQGRAVAVLNKGQVIVNQ